MTRGTVITAALLTACTPVQVRPRPDAVLVQAPAVAADAALLVFTAPGVAGSTPAVHLARHGEDGKIAWQLALDPRISPVLSRPVRIFGASAVLPIGTPDVLAGALLHMPLDGSAVHTRVRRGHRRARVDDHQRPHRQPVRHPASADHPPRRALAADRRARHRLVRAAPRRRRLPISPDRPRGRRPLPPARASSDRRRRDRRGRVARPHPGATRPAMADALAGTYPLGAPQRPAGTPARRGSLSTVRATSSGRR